MNVKHVVTRQSSAIVALIAAATCLLSACSVPEVLPPSGQHPVLTLTQVKLYQNQPKKYELLGPISVAVTPEIKWDERGDCTLGYEALKAQAAAKGANGVLLMRDKGTYDYSVGVGYQGSYYLVPMQKEPRTALAQAIFVIEE